jgi:hypothetical protein
VALALAGGATQKQAGIDNGVTGRTVGLWLAEPDFKARVTALRGEMVARAVGKLADGAAAAADELRRLLSEAEADAIKLQASKAVLELGTRLRESAELEGRLAELEARVARQAGQAGGVHAGGADADGRTASGPAGGPAGAPPAEPDAGDDVAAGAAAAAGCGVPGGDGVTSGVL